MSDNYVPKKGDIVNVTLREARVTKIADVPSTGGGQHIHLSHPNTPVEMHVYVSALGTNSHRHDFELVLPAAPATLPTTPGSIVCYKHDATELYVRVEDGWFDIDEKYVIKRTLRPNLYEVVFDAGADR